MDLHPGEEVVFEGHPSWRALLSLYARAIGVAVVVALAMALLVGPLAGLLAFAVPIAVVCGAVLVERAATVYVVTTRRLYIRRGVLARRVQQTRVGRVQNVNTDQSFLDRVLRVGTVDVDTAGTDDSEFRFVGIAAPDAVVAAVDRVKRRATERVTEPRFVREPR